MLFTSIYPRPESIIDREASNTKEKATIKFPSDIQAIMTNKRSNYGNLYLGNIESAQNLPLLSHLQITTILSVASNHIPNLPRQQVRYHKYVPIQDNQNADIHPYIHQCVDFIADKLLFTNVLIHCVNGLNRSACFAIAFLMKERRMSLEQAIKEVKSKRRLVQLSRSLLDQLRKYEIDLMNLGHSKRKYSYSARVQSSQDISSISPSYFKQNTVNDGSLLAELYTQQDRIIEPSEDNIREREMSLGSEKRSRKSSFSKEDSRYVHSVNPEAALKWNQLPDFNGNLMRKRSSSREQFHKKIVQVQQRNEELNKSLLRVQQKYQNELKASKITFRRNSQRSSQPELLEGGAIQPNLFTGLLE